MDPHVYVFTATMQTQPRLTWIYEQLLNSSLRLCMHRKVVNVIYRNRRVKVRCRAACRAWDQEIREDLVILGESLIRSNKRLSDFTTCIRLTNFLSMIMTSPLRRGSYHGGGTGLLSTFVDFFGHRQTGTTLSRLGGG